MDILVIATFVASLLLFILQANHRYADKSPLSRLKQLSSQDDKKLRELKSKSVNWDNPDCVLKRLNDRLGSVGAVTITQRRKLSLVLAIIVIVVTVSIAAVGAMFGGFLALFVGLVCGLYFATICAFAYMRWRKKQYVREIIFYTPLTMETLILLVESGLGILPAIEHISNVQNSASQNNPVADVLRTVHKLASHGMPISDALEAVANAVDIPVLRHVLLHLDISGSEGGELIPALRSLSSHTATEWKLSVEDRVKRLENLVVFPVFASVIGLMLLTASVPIVPVLKLKDTMSNSNYTVVSANNINNGSPGLLNKR